MCLPTLSQGIQHGGKQEAQGKQALCSSRGTAGERILYCQHPPAPQPCLPPRTESPGIGIQQGIAMNIVNRKGHWVFNLFAKS